MTEDQHQRVARAPLAGVCAILLLVSCAGVEPPKMPTDGPSSDRMKADSTIAQADFSPDSRYIGHVDTSGTVHLWDVFLGAGRSARENLAATGARE